jgi:hypothetical protein
VRRALPGALWFFVSAWWFLADAWLAHALGAWRIDLAVAFGVFACCAARASALPWLLACAGIARALALGGGACVHVLILGVPVAALFPLRRLPAPAWLVQLGIAALLALALPALSALAQRAGEAAPPPLPRPPLGLLLWSTATAPLAAAVLGRLPPLWFFRETAA